MDFELARRPLVAILGVQPGPAPDEPQELPPLVVVEQLAHHLPEQLHVRVALAAAAVRGVGLQEVHVDRSCSAHRFLELAMRHQRQGVSGDHNLHAPPNGFTLRSELKEACISEQPDERAAVLPRHSDALPVGHEVYHLALDASGPPEGEHQVGEVVGERVFFFGRLLLSVAAAPVP
eukprot:CAMPEP_0185281838 /NCGR_PEP_ID=MMETSP1359-20130426/66943_1 /TAXON_ID=552665 /ORGANISM="Bigelowiella longifila, Strain CCMP242" /LENGTH=176 /DNA_ID=CAMNT_0027877319 /DNA_START=733 /DNA_END=1259 /DNA_ORIENTATION=-